jgi:hypothetical protein
MIRINIDNLNIRLKGQTCEKAKVVSNELRNHLMKQVKLFAHKQLIINEKFPAHINLLDAGVILPDYDCVEPTKISELIASRIINSIFNNINQTFKEEK